ncbi:hypothetical protein K458DRAFT_473500 [Lentithecium fluviatile CBS 122367]|uniref:RRM domain-containing protein n=1 Tax=Lentithecium fluviatile CBS 122367 TaxID=1168545 RepID=A0A6G1JNR5_9PLEO|nr:hypothetical protein K458DRAFT_473500 [Lentithecium fluviatile CBS 122367]
MPVSLIPVVYALNPARSILLPCVITSEENVPLSNRLRASSHIHPALFTSHYLTSPLPQAAVDKVASPLKMSMSKFKQGVSDGDYLVIASGQPRYVSYLASWEAFKDHVRTFLKGQPGWTDLIQDRQKGEVQGWCRLKDTEDAESVYNGLTRSGGALVHIFATSKRNTHYNLAKCNCVMHFPDVGDQGHSPRRSAIDAGVVNQALGNPYAVVTPQYAMPAQPAYQYPNCYQTSPYTPSSMYTYPYSATPMQYETRAPAYSQSSAGLPVNLGQGAAVTESRGIFIQGLNYSVGSSDLISLIHSVGLRPLQARVHKDSRGSSKGVGSALFSSKEEAQYGVKALNGKALKDKPIIVRLDTESTIVGIVPPMVVDGTNKSAYGN